LEGFEPGGQLMITSDVENFPGFKDGILGPELMEAMRGQAERVGTDIVTELATEVDLSHRPFTVKTAMSEFKTRTIIIATGASAKWLGLHSETALYGKGVSACATCDGFFFRGKNVIVVGGGDTAMEEAIYLSKLAASITVIHRRDTLRASRIMAERALNNPKISFIWNSAIKEILDPADGQSDGRSPGQPANRRGDRSPDRRRVHRHRPQAQHRPVRGAVGPGRQRLYSRHQGFAHGHSRRVRGRRRARYGVSAGRDRRRIGLHGRPGRRPLFGGRRGARAQKAAREHRDGPVLRADETARAPLASAAR
jgi:hypothetical protein